MKDNLNNADINTQKQVGELMSLAAARQFLRKPTGSKEQNRGDDKEDYLEEEDVYNGLVEYIMPATIAEVDIIDAEIPKGTEIELVAITWSVNDKEICTAEEKPHDFLSLPSDH